MRMRFGIIFGPHFFVDKKFHPEASGPSSKFQIPNSKLQIQNTKLQICVIRFNSYNSVFFQTPSPVIGYNMIFWLYAELVDFYMEIDQF